MSDMTVNRLGQINGAGDTEALFLKVYAGEVLTAFDEENVMKNLHMSRRIEHGKSASFPATGKTGAGYHTPGTQLLGSQSIKHNERLVYIDDILLSDLFIAKIDELKNHYDVRGEYAKQQGAALSRAYDKRAIQAAVLAARSAATVSGGYGGSVIKNTSMATDASVLASALYTAARTFDEKDVPDDGSRYAVMKPAQYYLLLGVDKLTSRDYGSANDYIAGRMKTAAGIEIIKSNNVPSTNIAAVTGENNTYSGDFTDTVASVFHRSAIGTVSLMDLVVSKTADDGDFATMYNGTLLVAKMAVGTGILRPESAIELSKSA